MLKQTDGYLREKATPFPGRERQLAVSPQLKGHTEVMWTFLKHDSLLWLWFYFRHPEISGISYDKTVLTDKTRQMKSQDIINLAQIFYWYFYNSSKFIWLSWASVLQPVADCLCRATGCLFGNFPRSPNISNNFCEYNVVISNGIDGQSNENKIQVIINCSLTLKPSLATQSHKNLQRNYFTAESSHHM